MQGSPATEAPPPRAPAERISADQLLRLARAFSCVFWGVPIGLLLFFDALRFHFWSRIPLPPYVIGIALIYVGAILLYAAGRLTPAWHKRVRILLLLLFLHVYFAPFVYWWQRRPELAFFMVNIFGLILCSLAILFTINRLAGELARAVGDASFRIEAAVCAGSVILLHVVPFAAAVAFASLSAIRHEATLYRLFIFMVQNLPGWVTVILLLPFTMTMACAWKAKESCLRLLKQGRDVPAADSPRS